jgi:hypothetical protein
MSRLELAGKRGTVDANDDRNTIYRSAEEWQVEGRRLFGSDVTSWKSRCPGCGNVASVADYKKVGAPHADSAFFNCIGRYTKGRSFLNGKGRPCSYTSGGLFMLNRVFVRGEDGKYTPVFDFAEEDICNEPPSKSLSSNHPSPSSTP